MRFYTFYLVIIDKQIGYFGLKMHLTTTGDNALTHIFDHIGQLIGTDVWMYIYQDIGICSMLAKDRKNAVYIAFLFTTGIEFPIRISTRTTFAKTVVRLGIDHVLTRNLSDISLAVVYIFTTLQHNGAFIQFY